MSVKGFLINGSVVKYDYNSLDNKPSIPTGTGISDDLKAALLQLAEKVAYIDANGSDYYQDLYEALYNEPTYTVTNNLTDVTNSNSATRVTQGGSYSATLTPTSGYTINSVTVTMGGNDVTGTAYSSGTISIANVTGDIVITAVATQRQATLLSITATFSQGSAVIFDDASLDSLKQYLAVTANYDDSSSETLADSAYTLSGTLTAGTSTITASYGGKSDTFNVTVTHRNTEYVSDGLIMWLDGEKNGLNGAHETTLTTWVDQTGNGWDWTNGSGTAAATANAKSVLFDGSNDYLYRSYQSLPSNVQMMEIVFKGEKGGIIISGFGRNKIGNINIASSSDMMTCHTGTGTSTTSNTAMRVGTGNAMDNTIRSVNSAGYINGEAVTTSNNSSDWQYEYPSIGRYLGSSGTGNEYQFKGEIYCIRLYSRILTEAEILANYAVDAARFGIGG